MLERLADPILFGSTFVFYLLFAFSAWAIAKTIERWSFFRARRDDLERVGNDLVSRLRHGDIGGADLVLAQSPSLEAALVRPALDWIDGGTDAVETVLDAKRIENRRDLQRSLFSIAIIGRQAPWIGVLGTIIGLVNTLRMLEQEPGKDAMRTLWHGLSIGLIPVGAGVVVGIATAVAHAVLREEVRQIDENAAILCKQLLAVLRFQKKLAAEFGLAENGLSRVDGGSGDPEPADEDIHRRPLSLTELD